jgi:hypothetical protein
MAYERREVQRSGEDVERSARRENQSTSKQRLQAQASARPMKIKSGGFLFAISFSTQPPLGSSEALCNEILRDGSLGHIIQQFFVSKRGTLRP